MRERGFTLVELMITIGLTALLMGVVITFMTNSIVQYAKTESRSSLLNEAQVGLDVISSDIRLSGNADLNNRISDNYAPSAPGNKLSWQSDNDILILATATKDNNDNIIFADPALYISEKDNNVYYLQGGNLYRRTLANNVAGNSAKTTCPATFATPTCPADKKLLSNVASFQVKYYNDQNVEVTPTDARSIELYVKLQKPAYGQQISVDYSTRMVFRND